MAPSRMLRHRKFLKELLEESDRFKRERLIDKASIDEINSVSELVLNILNGNLPIDTSAFKALKKHRKMLKILGLDKRKGIKQRKEVMKQQMGGSHTWKHLCRCWKNCYTLR